MTHLDLLNEDLLLILTTEQGEQLGSLEDLQSELERLQGNIGWNLRLATKSELELHETADM